MTRAVVQSPGVGPIMYNVHIIYFNPSVCMDRLVEFLPPSGCRGIKSNYKSDLFPECSQRSGDSIKVRVRGKKLLDGA